MENGKSSNTKLPESVRAVWKELNYCTENGEKTKRERRRKLVETEKIDNGQKWKRTGRSKTDIRAVKGNFTNL